MSIVSNKRIKSTKSTEYKKRNQTLLLDKFVNLLMLNGKKNLAFNIFCRASYEFALKTRKSFPTIPPNVPLVLKAPNMSNLPLVPKASNVSNVPKVSKAPNVPKVPSVPDNFKNSLKKRDTFTYLKKKRDEKVKLQGSTGESKNKENTQNTQKDMRFRNSFIGKHASFQHQSTRPTKTTKKVQLGNSGKKGNNMLLQLNTVINNVRPSIEGRKCRQAGASKLIPAIVPEKRSCSIAMRWIVESAKKRKKTSKLPMYLSLAQEFIDAYQKQGKPRQRRDQLYKACEGNRGFLRYKWW